MGFETIGSPAAESYTYTTPEPATVVVMPGRLRVAGRHVIAAQRIQFAAGKGPSGGAFTGRWILNGSSLGTITVADGATSGSIAAPASPTLVDGDLLTVEVLGLGGATGTAVFLLDRV